MVFDPKKVGFTFSADDVVGHLSTWLASGLGKIENLDGVHIDKTVFVLLPLAQVRCIYDVPWTAHVVRIDWNEYHRAVQLYQIALMEYRSIPNAPPQDAPKEPQQHEYELLSDASGTRHGNRVSYHLFECVAGDVPVSDRLMRDVAKVVSGAIGKHYAQAKAISEADAKQCAHDNPAVFHVAPRRGDAWLFGNVPAEFKDLTNDIEQEGSLKLAGITGVRNIAYPPFGSGGAYKLSVENRIVYPVVLVTYTRNGQSYTCVIDGCDPTDIDGEKARRGAGEMISGLFGRMFGKKS